MQTVFVQPERCIGCRQCEYACAVEHSYSRHPVQALAEEPMPRTRIHVEPGAIMGSSFPNRCRHCDPAPCQQVCPTGALTRNAGHDVVLLDANKCIACALCAMVCPFDALTFHAWANGGPARVVALKCDGCIDRVDAGREPACVQACKVDALVFGEINDLVRAERQREGRAVLAAAAPAPRGSPTAPEPLAGWRAWGEAAHQVSEEVSHGQSH